MDQKLDKYKTGIRKKNGGGLRLFKDRCCSSAWRDSLRSSLLIRWNTTTPWKSLAPSSLLKRCCRCNFSETLKRRQIILEPGRNSPKYQRWLLWWHKTLPGTTWTETYWEPPLTSKIECCYIKFNGLKLLCDYAKTLHLGCLRKFSICLY